MTSETKKKQIVVLERGFVYVGDVSLDDTGLKIENAQNVRRWGTTRGLGELALEGAKANTKLDDAGTVRAPMSALIHLIDCNADKWPSSTPTSDAA